MDIHEQNPDLFKTEWADIFRLMGHSRKKEELKVYMEQHREEIQRLSKDAKLFLAVLLDQYEILEDGKVEVKTVCEAWDGAMQMYYDEAYEKATKELTEKHEKATKELTEKYEKEYEKKIENLQVEVNNAKEKAVEKAVEKASNQFKKLISILTGEQKYAELQRVAVDDEYCHKLFVEYGI